MKIKLKSSTFIVLFIFSTFEFINSIPVLDSISCAMFSLCKSNGFSISECAKNIPICNYSTLKIDSSDAENEINIKIDEKKKIMPTNLTSGFHPGHRLELSIQIPFNPSIFSINLLTKSDQAAYYFTPNFTSLPKTIGIGSVGNEQIKKKKFPFVQLSNYNVKIECSAKQLTTIVEESDGKKSIYGFKHVVDPMLIGKLSILGDVQVQRAMYITAPIALNENSPQKSKKSGEHGDSLSKFLDFKPQEGVLYGLNYDINLWMYKTNNSKSF